MEAAGRLQLQRDLRRLADGDRGAAPAVFAALWPPCLELARRALRRDDDAEDAAQAALVKLFAAAPSFDAARSGLGWALALVTWECRTVRKKRARSKEEVKDVDVGVESDVDAALDSAKDVEAVVRGFVVLDDADQQTLRALIDGEAAGDPAARKRRQRALDRLRALVLGEDHG